MRCVDEMNFGSIRGRLELMGVVLTDEQFDNLTYRELKRVYKKAEKVARLKKEIQQTIHKPEPKRVEKK